MLLPEDELKTRTAARAKAWCIICFGVGLLLTNYPLLQIFNQPQFVGGIPLLVVYLLSIWLLGVVVLYLLMRILSKSLD
ncbi:hypothetical protein [Desulfobacca acetoxidans]|jgi:hypothetical protein|uniref:Uncharacterized protein n=1 Tax=Desulfobacca acetoxidans (strain ATCC 700848 / DSM 11109 / ASRB2) TaxID=880072 RepID=F2NEI2_DESAR|nr:hypothetical protein [Desulfobacca acetoxidans]AEB08172.1 hypothetical protein Desac_0281 [Desulfobacca acetoxidans DSM 11109]HAY22702.1 hypothetical protein [Desulfobacterales bacterium]